MAGVQPEALSVRHRSRSTVALRLSATDCGFFFAEHTAQPSGWEFLIHAGRAVLGARHCVCQQPAASRLLAAGERVASAQQARHVRS